VKTTLSADGKIPIPEEIRQSDHLATGDSFELARLTHGQYLLTKAPSPAQAFSLSIGHDGLPVIRVTSGSISSQLVKDIEGQMP
jgi:bifunctional DNA-binding transcriptional regulator/antitoxin component of YhaV-PrlF toxin-antitoxin module